MKNVSGELCNIVFLDFDGVLNLNIYDFTENIKAKEPIINLNKFCLENEFKIVVISSWRKSIDCKALLYKSGLDERIEVIGATDILGREREAEVIDYLEKHQNINKFIIIDDGEFDKLKKYQIQTKYENGFDKEKYQEACELIKNIF